MEEHPNLLPSSANPAPAAIRMMKDDEYDIPISSWFIIIVIALIAGVCYDIPISFWFIIIVIALIAGVCYYIAVLSWRHFETVKQEKIDKATRNKEAAKANETPFIEVHEDCYDSIWLYYKPAGKLEFVNGVDPTVPVMTRWSYEDAVAHLAASTKSSLHLDAVSTPEQMEHVEKILRNCPHFTDVYFSHVSSPMSQRIYNLVMTKSFEMNTNNISTGVTTEFGNDGLSALHIKVYRRESEVESIGFCIGCEIVDLESIAYSKFLVFLKELSNKNKHVFIELDGPKFEDLFADLGWQYGDYMENLTYGMASNIRLANDSNVYCLAYWDRADSDSTTVSDL